MTGFRFRLERVLLWRETQLALEESEMERLMAEKRTAERAIRDLQERERQQSDALRAFRSGSPNIHGMETGRRWVLEEDQRLRRRLTESLAAIEKRSASIREARRGVELIRKLRERHESVWKKEIERRLDEMAGESAIHSWLRERAQELTNSAL